MMTAVETLRSRAAFAKSRGSYRFAEEMLTYAALGEQAARDYLDSIRKIGKAIVDDAEAHVREPSP